MATHLCLVYSFTRLLVYSYPTTKTFNMKNLFFSLMAALGLCSGCTAQDGVEVLTPQEFIAAAEADSAAVILDVRQPDEFAAGHLAKAVNLDWLNPSAFSEGMAKLDKDHTYYIYCRSGRRSNAAASKLKREGFRVFDMKGGYLQWTSEGRPVVR